METDEMTAFETPRADLESLDVKQRRELISAYLDGELSADESRHVTEWLDTNPGALREVEHIRRTWDLLEAYEDEPVPEGFAARVFETAGVQREEKEGRVLRMAIKALRTHPDPHLVGVAVEARCDLVATA